VIRLIILQVREKKPATAYLLSNSDSDLLSFLAGEVDEVFDLRPG